MKKKIPIPNEWCRKDTQHTDRCWWWLASLFMAAMLALIATACEPDALQVHPETPEEGLPATLRIDVSAHEPISAQTRAVNTTAITDLHILVYNGAGELIGQKYAKNLTAPYSITINTRSANNCTIYAIANTANQTLFDGGKVMKESDLKAMTTDDLTSWDKLTNGTHLVMTGKKARVTIAAGSPESNKIGNLSVSRIAAKVTFNIAVKQGSAITITDYQIYNLPKFCYYVSRPMANEESTTSDVTTDPDTSGCGDDAVDTTKVAHWINSENIEVITENAMLVNTTFYMYENRRGIKTAIGSPTQKDKNKDNAFPKSTYVEIKGKSGYYKAVWRIYLGGDNIKNYNTKRNSEYVYNITLSRNAVDTRIDINDTFPCTDEMTTSNCYILCPGNALTIPVKRANESPYAIGNSPIENGKCIQLRSHTPWTAEVVWQTSPNLVDVSKAVDKGPNGRFKVTTTNATQTGNAVVAIRSGGNIIWSWHIWVVDSNQKNAILRGAGTGNVWMDRNLGALTNTVGTPNFLGLMYQWGRKDPFPGSKSVNANTEPTLYTGKNEPYTANNKSVAGSSVTGTLGYAFNHPENMIMQSNATYNDWLFTPNNSLWGGSTATTGGTVKSAYDPCPAGWKIPSHGKESWPIGLFSPTNLFNSSLHALNFSYNSTEYGWFPSTGHRAGFITANDSKEGFYWTASTNGGVNASFLHFSGITNAAQLHNDMAVRVLAFTVRCRKE